MRHCIYAGDSLALDGVLDQRAICLSINRHFLGAETSTAPLLYTLISSFFESAIKNPVLGNIHSSSFFPLLFIFCVCLFELCWDLSSFVRLTSMFDVVLSSRSEKRLLFWISVV